MVRRKLQRSRLDAFRGVGWKRPALLFCFAQTIAYPRSVINGGQWQAENPRRAAMVGAGSAVDGWLLAPRSSCACLLHQGCHTVKDAAAAIRLAAMRQARAACARVIRRRRIILDLGVVGMVHVR